MSGRLLRPFLIRPATAADVEEIIRLDRLTQNLPHWNETDYRGAYEAQVADSSAGGVCRCLLVAEIAGSLVGFVVGKVTTVYNDMSAELESVAVAESARRTGIGRALCVAVIDWARRHGAHEMQLELRSRSKDAQALYFRLGFREEGTRRNYYRQPEDDAVLMRVDLWAPERPMASSEP